MEKFTAILIMAISLEGIVGWCKMAIVDKSIKWQIIATGVGGIFVALSDSLDAPAMLGVDSVIPYVGQIITGISIARGSNYIFDWIGKMSSPIKERQS
jgi:hypothetical protein